MIVLIARKEIEQFEAGWIQSNILIFTEMESF